MKLNPAYPESRLIANHIDSLEVTYITLNGEQSTGVIEVHHSVVSEVEKFFKKAYLLGFPIEKAAVSSDYDWQDSRITAANVTSGFNYRLIAGSSRLSLHSYGLAFDVNPRLNPYIRYQNDNAFIDPRGAVYDPSQPGTLTTTHPLVVFMKESGWEWGGDWTRESGRIDYQHFQKNLPAITDRVQ